MIDVAMVVGMVLTFYAGMIGEAWWNGRQERRARDELRRQARAWSKILQDIDDRRLGIIPLTVAKEQQ